MSKVSVGRCAQCGRDLRVVEHGVRKMMHLTCKCGAKNVILPSPELVENSKKILSEKREATRINHEIEELREEEEELQELEKELNISNPQADNISSDSPITGDEEEAIDNVPTRDVETIIQQMNLFSWNYVSREDKTDKNTTTLHFIRNNKTPNLDLVKKLEKEYPFGPLPDVGPKLKLPGIISIPLVLCLFFLFALTVAIFVQLATGKIENPRETWNFDSVVRNWVITAIVTAVLGLPVLAYCWLRKKVSNERLKIKTIRTKIEHDLSLLKSGRRFYLEHLDLKRNKPPFLTRRLL